MQTITKKKVVDCRLFPSEIKCSLMISGTEDEFLETAIPHAITRHGHKNSPELRTQIKGMMEDER